MPYTRNPVGKNQHGDVAKVDDEVLIAALEKYHHEKVTNNTKISQRLFADYGIKMSDSTVKRRRRILQLTGSGTTTKAMPYIETEQLVLTQIDKDPSRHAGVRTVQQKVAFDTGVHLTRDRVSEIMHRHDPEGFKFREPASKRILRFKKFPIGIHERWAADGHDKLYKIEFPIWAVVDDATSRWLGAWVVPSNRMGEIIAYLFLCLVETFGGIPLQFTTDCGSETTKVFGLMNALRTIFYPDIDVAELPAHVYLRSVHNIAIERSWLRLRLDWGDNVVIIFRKGIADGIYNDQDPQHYELCQWLWPVLLRKDLQNFMEFRNGAVMRKDAEKAGPSGMSRNEAFSLPDSWGGRDCLLPVDVSIIQEIKEAMGGDEILEFVSADFSEQAQTVYDTLNMSELTLQNIWDVFAAMLPLLFT